MKISSFICCLWYFAAVSVDSTGTPPQELQGTRLDVDMYGNIYLLNADNNTLSLVSKEHLLVARVGSSGWQNDQFDRPAGLWARNGIDVFVADYGNHRIQRFDRKLNFVSSLSTRDNDDPDQRFGYPTDVAFSSLGDLFICDSENSRIVKVNRFTRVEKIFGGFDAGGGRLQKPSKVEIGPKDCVYVLDGERIVVFDYFGNFLSELAPGIFQRPVTLLADKLGVVVADDDRIYRFDEQNRFTDSLPIESIAGSEVAVHSLSLSNTALYILTTTGLMTVADPWSGIAR